MKSYNSPSDIAIEVCQSGIARSQFPTFKFIMLAILGGMFIAFGGLLTLIVAGGMPELLQTNPGIVRFAAGALFPIGLILVTVAGGDLFTSDCMIMTLPYLDKKIAFRSLIKIWLLSYLFNFVGTQFIAYFMANEAGLLANDPYKTYLHNVAYAKMNLDFYTTFVKGVGANWLVCLGAWMGFAGKDIMSKAIGIWIPVMLFVVLGYEHSIANMFFIPAAMYSGADIAWADFALHNLVPATLGNIVGGAGLVGLVYWYVYLKK